MTEDDKTVKENNKPIIRVGGSKSKLARLFEESGERYFYTPEETEDKGDSKS